MLAGADNLGGWVALADGRGAPAEAGDAELAQGAGNEDDAWRSVGALAEGIVNRIENRAARIAPRREPAAPAGQRVAAGAGRRTNHQENNVTIGTTRFFATVLAGIARERPDRGEPLLGYIEAEAGYLRERMPGTADAMREACAEARRLRGRGRMAAE